MSMKEPFATNEGNALAVGKHRVGSLVAKRQHNPVTKLYANALTNEALQLLKLTSSLTVGCPVLAFARYRSKDCSALICRRLPFKPTVKSSILARDTPVCGFKRVFHGMPLDWTILRPAYGGSLTSFTIDNSCCRGFPPTPPHPPPGPAYPHGGFLPPPSPHHTRPRARFASP